MKTEKAKKPRIIKPKLTLSEMMMLQIQVLSQFGITNALPEFMFHPKRKWRFDFAFPGDKIAIECEGGVFTGGRHVSGSGMSKDCEKYNEAALLGWKVLRFTAPMIRDKTNPPWKIIAKAMGIDISKT
jgi:very-short-patch-repair endonuclease